MTGAPRRVNHCHCSRRRKVRGTAHATNLVVAIDGVRFLRGEDQLVRFELPEAERFAHEFCRVCGSSMPNRDPERGWAIVPMGAFDEDPIVRPSRHIHVESKAPWDVVTDDLPQFPAGPRDV